MAILVGYLFLNKEELPSSHKVTLEKRSAIIEEEKNFIYDNKDKEKKQNNESKNLSSRQFSILPISKSLTA